MIRAIRASVSRRLGWEYLFTKWIDDKRRKQMSLSKYQIVYARIAASMRWYKISFLIDRCECLVSLVYKTCDRQDP